VVDGHALIILRRDVFVSVHPEQEPCFPLVWTDPASRYVAMHAMQEEHGGSQGHERHPSLNGYSDNNSAAQKKDSRPQMRDTVATVVGMLLPLLTQFSHHH